MEITQFLNMLLLVQYIHLNYTANMFAMFKTVGMMKYSDIIGQLSTHQLLKSEEHFKW